MRKAFLYIVPLLGFVCIKGFASQPLFLEREIHSAIETRDRYYNGLGIRGLLFPFTEHNTALQDTLRCLLTKSAPDGVSPWFYFLCGLAAEKHKPDSMPFYFKNALSAAGSDPATVWTLAMEFGRCDRQYWEIESLKKLEKLLLISGATASRVISQPLLYKALSFEKLGDLSTASTYDTWAMRFDRTLLWTTLRKTASSFPLHIFDVTATLGALFEQTGKSWQSQCSLVLFGVVWLRWCLLFCIIGFVAVLGIKYLPSGIHWIAELFPADLPHHFKLYLAFLLFASLLSFGFLPFILIALCLVWTHCAKRDKGLAIIGYLLLLLFPLLFRTEDMLRQCLSPQATPSLFNRAIHEGFNFDLDTIIRKNESQRPGDYLAHAAAALYAVKNNDITAASFAMKKARSLHGDDQAVLITDGIVSYFSGDVERAKTSFETCTKMYPDYEPGFFNLGQYYLGSNETFKGMDYIDKATKLNQDAVNSFIKTNDDYFSSKWPRMRQFMPPEYKSGYFWINVFPQYWGDWNTTNVLWGNSFLGIRCFWYAVIIAGILMALLLFDTFFGSNHQAVKIFLCKLCDASMCRRCKKGTICTSCFNAVQQIRNDKIRQRIIEKIILKNRNGQLWRSSIGDVIFPGCGMLLHRGGKTAPALVCIVFSSSTYATVMALHETVFSYPFQTSGVLLLPLYYLAPLLNVAFAVRAFYKIREARA